MGKAMYIATPSASWLTKVQYLLNQGSNVIPLLLNLLIVVAVSAPIGVNLWLVFKMGVMPLKAAVFSSVILSASVTVAYVICHGLEPCSILQFVLIDGEALYTLPWWLLVSQVLPRGIANSSILGIYMWKLFGMSLGVLMNSFIAFSIINFLLSKISPRPRIRGT
jgi:hypothetical protein